jgi:Ribbon-helix-helix protein, copG family
MARLHISTQSHSRRQRIQDSAWPDPAAAGLTGLKPNSTDFISVSRTRAHHCFASFGAGEATSFWKAPSHLKEKASWKQQRAAVSQPPICPHLIPTNTDAQADLTYSHIIDMVFHMKTTLNIDDTVMGRLRREAARQGKTMSELVEAALRLLFHSGSRKSKPRLRPPPTFRSGGHLVDIADRDALYDVMEGRR